MNNKKKIVNKCLSQNLISTVEYQEEKMFYFIDAIGFY